MKNAGNVKVEMIQGLLEQLIEKVGMQEAAEMAWTTDEALVVGWIADKIIAKQ
jgi:hypothetical protein